MAEWRSQYCSTDNEYILFRIWVRETATNVIANTSTLRISVYAWRTNNYTTNYGGGCNVKIDGTARGYQYWNWGEKPVSYDSDTFLYDEEGIVINHNSDGTKSINVQATCEWYADGSIYIDSPYQGFDITLTALDRAAPTVSVSTSNIGVNSFTLSASTNVNCDRWDYSINNGSSWTNFSTTNTTSVSTTISGLSPNTTYNTKVRARKTSNQVYGTSGTTSPKTLGNAILNSVGTVTADNATVSFTINATVYVPSYTHKLEIKNGSTSILTKTGLTLANGNNTITLTSSERTTLLNAMSTIKSFTGTFVLSTWSGSTQIGSSTSKTATVQTTSANSAPTFTGFTYQDNNSSVVSVTGNDQIMVQNASTVRIVATAATAKNSATIKSYSVTFGNLSTSSTSTTITMGTITTSGTVAMTVTAIDSRGYSTSRSVNVTVVAYSKIVFTSSTIRRTNEVENTIQLSFAGNRKAITVGGTEKNSIIACQYRYKKTSDSSYGSYVNILSSVTTSGLNFSFSNNALVNLDANYSWNVQVYIQDKLTTDTLNLIVGQGIPLMSFRTKKVGINVLNPTVALDVAGDARISGTIDSTVKKLLTMSSDGTSMLASYQNAFANAPKSVGLAIRGQHGAHDMGFGWFLSGYDYAHAYGGFFISNYSTPQWIGVSNGTWTGPHTFLHTGSTVAIGNGGTGATTAANARTNLGLGSSATYNCNSGNVASTVVLRDGNGDFTARYITATHFNMSVGDQTGTAAYNGYVIYCNTDGYFRKILRAYPVYSGTLNVGSQATLTNGIHYKVLCVRVRPKSDGSYVSVTIPCRGLGTSAIRHQGTDETYYTTFDIWQSGDNVIIKTMSSNGSGYVARVEGLG